jgi:hypothetical protein
MTARTTRESDIDNLSYWSDIDIYQYDRHDEEAVPKCEEPCLGGQSDNFYHEESCNRYYHGIRLGMFEIVRKLLQDGIISLTKALTCIDFTYEEQMELTEIYLKENYDYGGGEVDYIDNFFKEGYEIGMTHALIAIYEKKFINDEQARHYST